MQSYRAIKNETMAALDVTAKLKQAVGAACPTPYERARAKERATVLPLTPRQRGADTNAQREESQRADR